MLNYVCIHGHFYQPPRENPWLEEIEVQDSAYPYHDWNERITEECYESNAWARILDEDGWIERLVNNYARMSFDFGPTLLGWLAAKRPEVYDAVIEADHQSRERFSGHGSAMAQAYNHMIMPLANRRDKYTQVLWGIRDFEFRFGRKPEGMWLPETAVDLETLDMMAEQGLSFVILAPHQARRVRRIGTDSWLELGPEDVDPSVAYELRLPSSGRTINVFFYCASLSKAVAFENLLANGEEFARRLTAGFSEPRPCGHQLVHIATDGETYGHHHRHGEMALAYALDYIESNRLASMTNYGEYLERYPPAHEVEIVENTSWSCVHGVERWRNDCGCKAGRDPGCTQTWRAPLRNALNWLRNTLSPMFEEYGRKLLKDPWAARDDYIFVILDRSPENVEAFLRRHALRPLDPAERVKTLKLLEMQRHAMLMYTSCGWFFDDISGIESVQIIQHAARAIQLAQDLFGNSLEGRFLELLAQAKSNVSEYGDGARIYERLVRPKMAGLPYIAANYAIDSLFEDPGAQTKIFVYTAERQDHRTLSSGGNKLAVGRVRVASPITWETQTLEYAAVHFGNHHLKAHVRPHHSKEEYENMVRTLTLAFDRGDLPEVGLILSRGFEGDGYSLKHLFRDRQRETIDRILDTALSTIEDEYRRIYESHAPLVRFLNYLEVPPPRALSAVIEFVLKADLRKVLAREIPEFERVAALLESARSWNVDITETEFKSSVEQALKRLAERISQVPFDIVRLVDLGEAIDVARELPFEVSLWQVQRIYYQLAQTVYQDVRNLRETGRETSRLTQTDQPGTRDPDTEYLTPRRHQFEPGAREPHWVDWGTRAWLDIFEALACRLRVRLPAPYAKPPSLDPFG